MARTTGRRRSSLLSPFALARRNAIYKGVLGGERGWLVVGGVVWGVRLLKKTFGKSEEVVTIETMQPGQWMSLRTIPSPTRRQRKAAKKSGKQARKR